MRRPERLRLELLGGDRRGLALPSEGRIVVGSDPASDLVVEGQGVHASHCAIGRLRDGGWAVRDLGSRHGTFVNGARVRSRRLASGDRIVLGSRRLAVVPQGAEPGRDAGADAGDDERAPTARRLGGYRLERRVGRGSMGEVWLAEQESLARPVALKILSRELADDDEFVRRFFAEARAAAALSHPNVVVVHDVGEADGERFLSMEFMAGGSLEEQVARSGPLPWREALDALHDAAAGLVYAEEKGILHRDLKPANLMRAASGAVKIADLGLATTVDAGHGSDDVERGSDERGASLATPHFASPEQIRGQPLDHRSDLYALGATAYRLLSGRTPFRGASSREILRAHLVEEPEPPGLHADVPPELDALVLRLLAKSPGARFPSARALLDEVDRLRAAADAQRFGPAAPGRTPSAARLVGVVLAAVAGALLLLVVLILVARRLPGPEEPRPDLAEAPERAGPDASGDPGADDGFYTPPPEEPDPYAAVESRVRRLDAEASEALAGLAPDLAPRERLDALRSILRRYPATDTAGRVEDEVRALEERLAREAAEAERRAAAVGASVAALREAAGWPPDDAGERFLWRTALEEVRGFQPPGPVARSPVFLDARDGLAHDLVEHALGLLEEERARLEAYAAAGDFESVAALLDVLLERFEPPPPRPGETPPLRTMRVAHAELQERRLGLAEEEAAWRRARRGADRAALAEAVGVGSGFAAGLRDLRLDELASRLAALAEALANEDARAFAGALRADLEAAAAACALLERSFAAGEWRRRSFLDPRDGSPVTARAVTPDGILLEEEPAGAPIPWSVFGDRAESVHQLFQGRLERAYTADEERAVAALLRLVAVAEAARAAGPLLEGGDVEPTTLLEPLAVAASWEAEDAGERARLARERAAAGRLGAAAEAARDGSWSRAVALLEELLGTHGDALLVRLLSDGTAWRPVPADASAASRGSEDAAGAASNAGGSSADGSGGER